MKKILFALIGPVLAVITVSSCHSNVTKGLIDDEKQMGGEIEEGNEDKGDKLPTVYYIIQSKAGNPLELSEIKPSEARVIINDITDINVGMEVVYGFEDGLGVLSHFSLKVEDIPYTTGASAMQIDADGLMATITIDNVIVDYRDVSIKGAIGNDNNSIRICGVTNDCPFALEIGSMTTSVNEFIPQKIDGVEVDRIPLSVMSITNATKGTVIFEVEDEYQLNDSFSIDPGNIKKIMILEENYPSEQLTVTITYPDMTKVTISGHEIVTSDCFVREGSTLKNYLSGDPSGAIVNLIYSAESFLIKESVNKI